MASAANLLLAYLALELVTLAPLAVIVVILRVYPHAVLDLINTSLVHLTEIVKAGGASGVAAR